MTPVPRPRECLSEPGMAGGHTARRMRIEMGTWVVIEAHAAQEAAVAHGLEAGFAALADIARHMHPRHEDSDVARINAAPPGTQVAIRPETLEVLKFAQRLHALSDGIFDPCLPAAAGKLADLHLSAGERPAARSERPLLLDLGGIAKGFAVDRALRALRAAGCTAGLVNAGGDLRVFGAAPRTILLRRPDGSLRPLPLMEAALAVSDRDAANTPGGHRGYYRRGARAHTPRRYAAVRAGDAMSADALTKCVLLCPAQLRRALLAQFGAEDLG